MYEVYIGGYQSADRPGIHHLRFDSQTGRLMSIEGITGIENPSYLYADWPRRHLYAASESDTRPRIFSYRIGHQGRLVLENAEVSSGGSPCHLMQTPSGQALLAANYQGATIDWFPLSEDGRMAPSASQVRHVGRGLDNDRQSAAHPHSTWIDPSKQFVLAPDLGLDAIMVYRIDATSAKLDYVTRVNAPPGSGPRHLAFHPAGEYAYVVNELGSMVSIYAYTADPFAMDYLDTVSTLPSGFGGTSAAAHIAIANDGTKLYASNRGHDSLAVFRVDHQGRHIAPVTHVATAARFPRHFALSPDQRWMLVVGQKADVVEVLRMVNGIPDAPGALIEIPQPTVVVIGKPNP